MNTLTAAPLALLLERLFEEAERSSPEAIALQIARFLLIDPARLYDLGHDTTRIR